MARSISATTSEQMYESPLHLLLPLIARKSDAQAAVARRVHVNRLLTDFSLICSQVAIKYIEPSTGEDEDMEKLFMTREIAILKYATGLSFG